MKLTKFLPKRMKCSFRREAILLAIAAAILLFAPRIRAQSAPTGPLPATAPSDKPPSAEPHVPMIGGKPKLAGSWTLNKDKSDNARRKLEQARGGGGSSGHSSPRPPISVGVPRYPYPYPPSRAPGGGGGGGGHSGHAPSDFMAEFSQLSIEQTESTLRVSGESGQMLAVFPVPVRQEAKLDDDSTANDPQTARAQMRTPPTMEWRGNQFVVEEERGSGSVTRTFELSPDGKQLYLTTKLDTPQLRKVVTIHYVYDPTPSGG